jgi:chaperonin cofactor prefoldin
MAKKSPLSSAKIIDQMIALHTQKKTLEQQIADLEPAFFEACNQQDNDQIDGEQALIYRKITPGRWVYPDNITKLQERLKKLKQQFQDTHEPNHGREVSWVVKIYVN